MSEQKSSSKPNDGAENFVGAARGRSTLEVLKKQSFRGGSISALFQILSLTIHFASTATLARLLSPAEFGVVGMAMAVVAFARLFRDLGLSSSTIQRESLTHEQLSTLHWVNVTAGGGLTLAVSLLAPLVALFFGRPELTGVTIVISFTFIIGSFGIQQSALMVREMQFGRRETASVIGSLSTFAASAILALNGFSYWSLAYGNIVGALVGMIMIKSMSKWHPGRPRRRTGIRPMLKYGASLTSSDLVNYFSRNLDNVLIGRFSGAEALGQYSKAYQLLMMPVTNLRNPISAVAFPALSRLQTRPAEFRSYYCTVVGVLALTSMPVVSLLYIVADPLILLMLGPQWGLAADLFSVLAFAAFLQTSSGFRGTALISLGMSKRYFVQGLIGSLVTCAGFCVGIQWGVFGVAVSYAITSVLMTYPMHVFSFRGTPLRASDYLAAIRSAAIASLIAGITTYGLRQMLWSSTAAILDLGASSLTFLTIYTGLLAVQPDSRRKLLRAWSMIRERLSRWMNSAATK